jgi:hypothetical protein
MSYEVIISRKRLILENQAIVLIRQLFEQASSESGLQLEQKTQSDKEEFSGGAKLEREGYINKLFVFYEKISDTVAGAHERILPQREYTLDAPARKLYEGYIDYLNVIFFKSATPKKIEKKDEKTQDNIIDSEHVFVREILLRLFTAAISVDKNNARSQEAKKIIKCLELFIAKINNTNSLYESTFFYSSVSSLNIAFSTEHKDWIFLLRRMQEVIELLHKHTATISKLIEISNKARSRIALQLIAYISKNDIEQEKLLPEWVKYTLLECEMLYLTQSEDLQIACPKDDSEFHQKINNWEKNCNTNWVLFIYSLAEKVWKAYTKNSKGEFLVKSINHHSPFYTELKSVNNGNIIEYDPKALRNLVKKHTLFRDPVHILCELATNNYNSAVVNSHQKQVIREIKNESNEDAEKIEKLYNALSKINILISILDQVDMLFLTTGWILIVSNVLNLKNLAHQVKDCSNYVVDALNYDIDLLPSHNNKNVIDHILSFISSQNNIVKKSNIIKSLVAAGGLNGTDFAQEFDIASSGIKELDSLIIKKSIVNIINTAIGNLKSLKNRVGCDLINQKELESLLNGEEKYDSIEYEDNKNTLQLLLYRDSPLLQDNGPAKNHDINTVSKNAIKIEEYESKEENRSNALDMVKTSFGQQLSTVITTANLEDEKYLAEALQFIKNLYHSEQYEQSLKSCSNYRSIDLNTKSDSVKTILCEIKIFYALNLVIFHKRKEAIQQFTQCISCLNGQSTSSIYQKALYSRAYLYKEEGALQEAKKDLESLIELNATHEKAWKLLKEITKMKDEAFETVQVYQSTNSLHVLK